MKITAIKYGALGGTLCGIMMTAAFYAGIQTKNNEYLTLGTLLLNFSACFFPIREVRQKLGGEIEFKKAIGISISAGILAAIVFSIFTITYYTILNPNFADPYLNDIEISLKQAGLKGEALKNEMQQWRQDLTAINQTAKTLLGFSFLNSIFAAISSLILCKKD
jgi:hypothetical protein